MKPIALLLLLGLLLTACETPGGPDSRVNPPAISRADQLYQQNRFVDAARAFAEAGAVGNPNFNFLRAADAYWMARDAQGTRRMLGRVDQSKLDFSAQALARLLGIASAGEPPGMTTTMRQLAFEPTALPDNYRVLFHHLRAETLMAGRQYYRSAAERVAMAQYLSPNQRSDNHQRILTALRSLSLDQADQLRTTVPPNDAMHGWLALTSALQVARVEGTPLRQAIIDWQSIFPNHPAANDSVDSLLGGGQLMLSGTPNAVALLLPMSGRFAGLGRAVRDGFLTAYYQDPEAAASVRVYDVGDSPERAALQYDLAVRDGAEQIIGPLSKEAVTEMLLKADGSVPVLALNESQDNVPAAPGIFQFGLLPEQEAASVARRMIADSKMRVIVLVPDNRWGERIAAEFRRIYESYGGQVLSDSRYPAVGTDFGPVITSALGLSASNNRVARLEKVTGLRLQAEAGARSDLDAIFLAARPNQGRLIKPQFDFHNAAEVPVYATSAIYAGRPDPALDKDMNGVRFCDAPWLIGAPGSAPSVQLARQYFTAGGTPLRLFGLGLDAYRLLPQLAWLLQSPTESFTGASGALSIDGNGRVYRELGCAEFRRGLAHYLEPPARLLDQPGG